MENKLGISERRAVTSVGDIGACLSDLVADVHALVTEDERGKLLTQRLLQIKATLGAISNHAGRIAEDREKRLHHENS